MMRTSGTAGDLGSRRWTVAGAAAVAAAGALAYADSFSGVFVLDDPSSIVSNPSIRHLSRIWTVLRGPHAMITAEARPVLNLSLAINYALGGTHPWGYHAVNLGIHLLAGLTLFGLARRTWTFIDRAATAGEAALVGAAIAALWTVHPLQTESVAYVIQRAESLMGLFYLLTLYCFVRGAGSGLSGWFVASAAACALGMASKEDMVSAPVIALLYDRTFLAGSFSAALRRRWRVYAALAATWGVLAMVLVGTGGNRGGSIGFGVGVRWWDYLLTQPAAIWDYIRLTLWPHPLVIDYGTFWVRRWPTVLPPALAVLALVAATLWALWRRPILGFAGFWFFSILAPTTLIPGTTQMIVEHRMYLALAPLLGVIVGGTWLVIRRRRAGRAGWLGGVCAAGAACVAVTAARNLDYRSAVGLWQKTVAERPNNVLARTLLGQALAQAGRPADALRELQTAVLLDPRFALAEETLGESLFRIRRVDDAIAHYRAAIREKPDFAQAHENLGVALSEEGDLPAALEQFHEAVRIDPDYAGALFNLGLTLERMGRPAAALAMYQATVRRDPANSRAHFHIAVLLLDAGEDAPAGAELRQAAENDPGFADARDTLGAWYLNHNQYEAARKELEAVVRLGAAVPETRYNLGVALLLEGRRQEAALQFEEALRIDPSFTPARERLASLR